MARQRSSNATASRRRGEQSLRVSNLCQPELRWSVGCLVSVSISFVSSGACLGVLVFIRPPAVLSIVERRATASALGHCVRDDA
jgi:hypothetical protein